MTGNCSSSLPSLDVRSSNASKQHARQASSQQDNSTSDQSPAETSCSGTARTRKLPMLRCTPLTYPQAMLPPLCCPCDARTVLSHCLVQILLPFCTASVQHFLGYATLQGNVGTALWRAVLLTNYRQHTAGPSLTSQSARTPRCSLGKPRKNRLDARILLAISKYSRCCTPCSEGSWAPCQNGVAGRISMLAGLMQVPRCFRSHCHVE